MSQKVKKSEAEWRRDLTPEQYQVLREKGTERPFTGEYWDTRTPGLYRCAGCGTRSPARSAAATLATSSTTALTPPGCATASTRFRSSSSRKNRRRPGHD